MVDTERCGKIYTSESVRRVGGRDIWRKSTLLSKSLRHVYKLGDFAAARQILLEVPRFCVRHLIKSDARQQNPLVFTCLSGLNPSA